MIIIGILVVVLLVASWFLFKDSMNLVQSVGSLYWITRNYVRKGTPIMSLGFMHELDKPWRTGKGVQIRFRKHSFQIGFCKKTTPKNEEEGILNAVGGRMLDTTAHEIGNW
jgi:hypothetical protein